METNRPLKVVVVILAVAVLCAYVTRLAQCSGENRRAVQAVQSQITSDSALGLHSNKIVIPGVGEVQ